jgi:hypothetical protein
MSQRPTNLDGLQRWMLWAITDPASQPGDLGGIVLPSHQQSPEQRLAVYQHAYFARLLEVLRELFPCSRFAVGDELFDQFCIDYLRRFPPGSYTLARLADKLAEYLEETRPADWGGFIVELVRMEHAIDRVFDAAGPEKVPPLALSPESTADMQVLLLPGFELHAFDYPVSRFFTDWKAAKQPTWPDRQPQFVALLRRDYIVRRYEVTAVQHELLQALSRGATLGEAVAAAAEVADSPVEQLAADFRDWFAFWAAERFFASYR